MSSSAFNQLQEIVKEYVLKAIEYDKSSQLESAIFYYLEASQALINFKQSEESVGLSDSQKYALNSKLNEYLSRAEALKKLPNKTQEQSFKVKTEFEKDIEKGTCLISEALDQDAEDNHKEAFDLYTSAVEFYLKIKSKPRVDENEKIMFAKFQKNVEQALKRAEELKHKIESTSSSQLLQNKDDLSEPNLDKLSLNNDDYLDDNENENNKFMDKLTMNKTNSSDSKGTFTKEEISVLRHGSFINNKEYVPFFPEIDSKEKFYLPIPFTDNLGKLPLSPSQLERFHRWARPDEIFDKPTLMMLVSSFSVKQTCISDCSFVASLTVCAQYERKFNKKIFSTIIYPQNKNNQAVYNPCGKYMVSLNLNGCARKVIIDDYLPVDKHNNLLCSLTTNRGELWVSLLEKAYMRVMGGYDFPGSNSNIDLHALTNWIPERLSLHGEHTDFKPDADFERIFERLHTGDVLITVATGPMSKQQEERSGLVSTHAYAVLDIRKFKSTRLLQLKNPWSHLRWKGNYSEYDIQNWSEELKQALNYDPKMACNVDNGIFWIDYESLLKFFDVFYLSWNPSLFPFTSCFHRKWSSVEGPIKDRYNLGENPQYVLRIKPSPNFKNKCSTWLLLTRHITDKADFSDNKEYIALVVYKNNGKRVYYPMEPEPFKEGVRINSPHYLVKLVDDCNSSPAQLTYTLVVSQYEKYNSIYFTLRAYSTQPFQMSEIKEPYNPRYFKRCSGMWKGRTAGGCANNLDTFKNNPLYQVALSYPDNSLKIELKGPQQYSVGFDVICVNSTNPNNPNNFKLISSGDYRRGYCVLTVDSIPGGTYHIRPSTYLPGQESAFFLEISSSHDFVLSQIQ